MPASCPQLTEVNLGDAAWVSAARRWTMAYRVSISNTSGPVRWTQTAYRRGVPNDRGTLLTSKKVPNGAATNIGLRLTCADLLKYGRVRLVATDRLGIAGWYEVWLPTGGERGEAWLPKACPSSLYPLGT